MPADGFYEWVRAGNVNAMSQISAVGGITAHGTMRLDPDPRACSTSEFRGQTRFVAGS
jgi:hypothetical protein